MRSKAAVGLASRCIEGQSIAATLGISTGMVSLMLSGQRKPGKAAREKIQDAYGIPPGDWDVPPDPLPESTVAEGLSRIETLEAVSKRLLSELDDPTATRRERAEVMFRIAQTEIAIRKLRGESAAEINVVRHPKYIQLRNLIFETLAEYPDALEAVARRLEAAAG